LPFFFSSTSKQHVKSKTEKLQKRSAEPHPAILCLEETKSQGTPKAPQSHTAMQGESGTTTGAAIQTVSLKRASNTASLSETPPRGGARNPN
jgi:hypothetical protein